MMKVEFFPAALVASVFIHAGFFGVSKMMPTPAAFPVQQGPSSIQMVLIQEPKPQPVKEIIIKEEVPEPVEETVPVVQKQEETPEEKPQEEIQESLGAMAEAVPLEFVNPAPEYPALARRRGWEGTVVIQVRVEKDGHPSSVTLAKSSGYRLLDDAALKSVRTWRFKPAQSGRITLASTVQIPVKFVLVEDTALDK